jgi:ABC-type sulfate transport system permease component
MTDTQLLTMAAALVAALFGLLATVVGWIGARVLTKLDQLVNTMHEVSGELHDRITVVSDALGARISGVDGRVIWLEAQAKKPHGKDT